MKQRDGAHRLAATKFSRRWMYEGAAVEKADPRAFRALWTVLARNNYRADPSRLPMYEIITNLDNLTWRPLEHVAYARLHGIAVLHQGVHHLMALRFGSELRRKPQVTLFAEAAASCIEVYFLLLMTRQLGTDHPSVRSYLAIYRRNARALGQAFAPQLRAALEDPFGVYKACVETMLAAYALLQSTARPRADRERQKKAVLEIAALPHFCFVRQFNLVNNVLFVGTNCGFRSSRLDREQVEQARADLARSETMLEFLNRLQTQT